MDKQSVTIRQVVWHDLFPWLMLGKAIRVAISPKVLILAMIGLLGVTAGWRIIGEMFSGTEDEQLVHCIEHYGEWPWDEFDRYSSSSAWARIDKAVAQVPILGYWINSGPVSNVFHRLADPFVNLFRADLTVVELAYYLLCCLWASLVWALSGGAITRIAALSFTREEPLSLTASIGQAKKRWPSYFAAPLLPLIGVLFVLLFLALGGLVMGANVGVFVGGLLWFLVLMAGLFLAIILLALMIGWPLMWPAISTEGTDAFDALSRCFAYVYQRPLYYLFLIAFSSILGIFGFLFVGLFVDATIYLGDLGISWGSGSERLEVMRNWPVGDEESTMGGVGASMRGFWVGAATLIKPAFQVGYFWVAATGVYLLMRRAVDSAEIDEITLDESEETYRVPPISAESTDSSSDSSEDPVSSEDTAGESTGEEGSEA